MNKSPALLPIIVLCATFFLVTLVSGYAQSPEPQPKLRTSQKGIANRYIVVLKDAPDGSKADLPTTSLIAQEMISGRQAKLRQVFSQAINAFSVEMSGEEAAALANSDSRINFIEQDSEVRLDQQGGEVSPIQSVESPATQQTSPINWGLDRIDQRTLPLNKIYNYTSTGTGVNVYLIDSGILPTHQEFQGRASIGSDFVGDGQNGVDNNGHGTHVAGIIGGKTYGVAKGVNLIAVRAMDVYGHGDVETLLQAIEWVKTHHSNPAVVNMSLGTIHSAALDLAVKNSIAAGMTFVLSAGNTNEDACNHSPADVAQAITVGATTRLDQRSDFSNWGKCVTLFAPGSDITSAWYSSNTSSKVLSGTSMAAPFVTGAVALYLKDHPTASPAAVKSAVTGLATLSRLSYVGDSSPNRLLYSPLGGTVTVVPPCQQCEQYMGSLTGPGTAGSSKIIPSNGSYFSTVAGTHKAWLRTPSGTEFELYLEYKDCSASGKWIIVASATSKNTEQYVSFFALPGTYRWRIKSRVGSGNYQFWLQHPS
jgi:subtilisin family serine protease